MWNRLPYELTQLIFSLQAHYDKIREYLLYENIDLSRKIMYVMSVFSLGRVYRAYS